VKNYPITPTPPNISLHLCQKVSKHFTKRLHTRYKVAILMNQIGVDFEFKKGSKEVHVHNENPT
jgi:hypothetical protein